MNNDLPDKRVSMHKVWAAIFWLTLCVLVVLGGAMWRWPELRVTITDSYDQVVEQCLELLLLVFPAFLEPFVLKGAEIFLTPWLYLVVLIVFLAEKYVPADRSQRVLSVGMIQDFVTWYALDGVVRVVVKAAYLGLLYTLYDLLLSKPHDLLSGWIGLLPYAACVLLAVLIGDFLHWFHHWLRHRVPAFWVFHTIHHSQRQMNMFTDLRVHSVERLIAYPIYYTPLYLLGLDFDQALWLSVLIESYSRVYHANIRSNYGIFKYILVTPQSHRIHHSREPRHMDKNFGVVFSIWDHLFGTQWRNYDEYPHTGIGDEGFPLEQNHSVLFVVINYIQQMVYPFQCLYNAARGRGWELRPGKF